MTVTTIGDCDLCGERGPIRHALVEWAVPVASERFADIDRCLDVDACRERIVTRGDLYPVREAAADGSRKEARL